MYCFGFIDSTVRLIRRPGEKQRVVYNGHKRGSQCTAYLLYQGMQLIHVDQDIKSYIKSNGCRRKQLLQYFDVDCSPQNPAHLCCDNCSVMCECGTYECKPLAYPLCRADLHLNSKRKRSATEEQKTTLVNKLVTRSCTQICYKEMQVGK